MVTVKDGSHGALREALDESEPFRDAISVFLRTGDLSGLPDEVDLPPLDWALPDLGEKETYRKRSLSKESF